MDTKAQPTTHVASAAAAAKPRLFYGWVIVLGAAAADVLTYGIGTVAFGIFFRFMSDAMEWSRGLLSSVLLLGRLTSLVANPILGPMVDRYGPRWIMLGGTIAFGLGAFAMAAINAPWQFFIAYGGLITLGSAALGGNITHTVVAKWFVRKRSRALALVTMSLSGAGVIIPLPLAFLISMLGWRGAWIGVGIFVFVVGTASSLVMRRQPEDYGLLPDGDVPGQEAQPSNGPLTPGKRPSAAQEVSLSAKEAVRTPAFWLMILSTNASGMAIMGINIHLASYLLDRGFNLGTVGGIVSFQYVMNTVAKPMWGLVTERLAVRYCIGICYLGGGVGVLLLLNVVSLPWAILFGVVFGLTRGATSFLTSLAWADYFGRRSQGSIRGISSVFGILAGAGGPVVAGFLYDATGSYTIAFLMFAVAFWVGAIFMVMAKPPQTKMAAPVTSPGA
ncbi:MAG: MFS transporter [Chloroflexi bacterium]|nr:MFS transporter [Chloroflexota bacterium]